MSDLISRSEVLELLYKIFDKYHMATDKNTSIGKSFGTTVFEEIRNMPTAYSVDKVVDELEEAKHEICLSDDVCEWNGEQGRLVTFTRFTTDCGDNIDLQTNSELLKAFRYCPFCGKKIKVVE